MSTDKTSDLTWTCLTCDLFGQDLIYYNGSPSATGNKMQSFQHYQLVRSQIRLLSPQSPPPRIPWSSIVTCLNSINTHWHRSCHLLLMFKQFSELRSPSITAVPLWLHSFEWQTSSGMCRNRLQKIRLVYHPTAPPCRCHWNVWCDSRSDGCANTHTCMHTCVLKYPRSHAHTQSDKDVVRTAMLCWLMFRAQPQP